MYAEVEIIEGGQMIRTEKMKLKMVKQFNDETTIYENEDGRAVIFFKERGKYVLVSIDMA